MKATVADLRALLERGAHGGGVPTASSADGSVLPVLEPLRPLFPTGGLQRGSTVEIGLRASAVEVDPPGRRRAVGGAERGGAYPEPVASGGCGLALAVLAGASAGGSWCVVVGAPGLGMVAAAESGIELSRCAFVPAPGSAWARAVGALVDGFDLVVVRPPAGHAPAEARALSARARHHGSVLVSLGPWPGATVRLLTTRSEWTGLGVGHGRLHARRVLVRATGRGAAAARPRELELWLPAGEGAVVAGMSYKLRRREQIGA